MSEGLVDGHPRQIWWNADGETMVESYVITDMAHGTPLGIADDDRRYGAQGAFLIEAGISSSYHIAKFFGLTNWVHQPTAHHSKAQPLKPAAESPSAGLLPKVSPLQAPPPAAMPSLSRMLAPLTTQQPRQEKPRQETLRQEKLRQETQRQEKLRQEKARKDRPKREPRRRGIDVGGVITRALTAAGLMK